MEREAFIDESGDLGERGSRYFIITAIWADDSNIFDRLIKHARRGKFRKELRTTKEIKAAHSSKELISYLLKKFSNIRTAHVRAVVLKKRGAFGDTERAYATICGNLAPMSIDASKLTLHIDRLKSKQRFIDDFNRYIGGKFKEARWFRNVEIFHSWSHAWPGLQIADVVSWAVFQKFEHGNEEFFKLIEEKIDILRI
ncbi:DUF3800 domain-containing protein [Candidatus Woesearchaeota archaeon]|nr:DUF3800 domain-containing protein [Candidatus Woesearchaeota archaeon]